MEKFTRHILSLGVVVVAILLTADAALGQKSVYVETEYNAADAPLLTFPLRHIMNGGAPYFVSLLEEELYGKNNDKVVADADKDDSDESGVTDGNAKGAVSGGNAGRGVSDGDAMDAVSGGDAEPEKINYVLSPVPDSYFDDALFIGDSRTVGLSEYCDNIKDRATFFSKVSLTIYAFSKKEFVEVKAKAPEGYTGSEEDLPTEVVTIEEALTRKQYAKVYIMLGLNEIGSGSAESFVNDYGAVIDRIRELQPNAIIYIQGIMHVTHIKSETDKVFRNSSINERNEALSKLADNEHVFYIDMNSATDDENGALGQDLSFDNVHLKAKSYALWYDYLKNHAYVDERDLDEIQKELKQETEQNNAEAGETEEAAQ